MGRFKKNSPGCGCCGVPPCNCTSIVTTDCGSSTPDVFYYTFTMPSLANDDCTSCSTWSGTFKLCWAGSNTWRSETSSTTDCSHTAGDPLYTLTRSGGYYWLTPSCGWPQYRLAAGSWQCAKPNVLSLMSPTPTPAACGSVPATITLTPCATCQHCNPTGSFPNRVQIDIIGVTAWGCSNCATTMNATFILNRVSNTCTLVKPDVIMALMCPGINEPQSWSMRHDAAVAQITPSLFWWQYRIGLWNSLGVIRYVTFRYTSSTKFDCSVSRTLSFVSQDRPFCDWSGATVTLTPL